MNYITHFTKKKQILARKEASLRRMIAANTPPAQLFLAARIVIDARIRVLRATRAQMPPDDQSLPTYANVDRKIAALKGSNPEDILLEYGWQSS
jgi:hypothetical protein